MSAQSNDRSRFSSSQNTDYSRFSDTRLHLNPKRTEMWQFFSAVLNSLFLIHFGENLAAM
jgi:hypothetical protein